MQSFMGKDFLLSTPSAVRLYHDFAAGMPIADYHCHINPQEIYEDKHFDNLFQVWLSGAAGDSAGGAGAGSPQAAVMQRMYAYD